MQIVLRVMMSIALGVAFTAWSADSPWTLETCFQCHGENGLAVRQEIPILAGTDIIVLEDALLDYRDGHRHCELEPTMCVIAQQLTEDQIADFAEYFSQLEFRPADQDFEPELADQGRSIHAERCVRCHGSATDFNPNTGRLFGQHIPHLRNAITQYRQGRREGLPTMLRQLKSLTDEEVEALLHYYASYDQGRTSE